jgi:hypothetical protein
MIAPPAYGIGLREYLPQADYISSRQPVKWTSYLLAKGLKVLETFKVWDRE